MASIIIESNDFIELIMVSMNCRTCHLIDTKCGNNQSGDFVLKSTTT